MNYGYTTPAKPFVKDEKMEKQSSTVQTLKIKKKDDKTLQQINKKELEQSKIVLNKLREDFLDRTKFYRNNEIIK